MKYSNSGMGFLTGAMTPASLSAFGKVGSVRKSGRGMLRDSTWVGHSS